ncbi:hypothetical protein [Mycoplasmopsis gallinacea]|uniref:Lipoprotein n=1 Tax=Mycoplasmopsis gallinacea TaxID=29556 RepID=A0A6H0V0N2_9BACT|nr:hypothetical protein [Mycoplasmopsis gallinacea]QIW61900.1 hypothetical protein GOQ20_00210 [Mycoplasmopsis gallinacea]
MKRKLNTLLVSTISALSLIGITSCNNEIVKENKPVIVEKDASAPNNNIDPKKTFILKLLEEASKEKNSLEGPEWWWKTESEWLFAKLPLGSTGQVWEKNNWQEMFFKDHNAKRLENISEIDNSYAQKLSHFQKYLTKPLSEYSKNEVNFHNLNNNFYGVYKYEFKNDPRDVNIKTLFTINKNIPNREYLSSQWTNLLLLKNFEEIESYAYSIQRNVNHFGIFKFKNEFFDNVLPVIEQMFKDYDAENNPNFRVAIIPARNNSFYLRNIFVDKNNLNLIARTNYLNAFFEEGSSKFNLLIVPLNYDLSYLDTPDISSKNPNILDLDREFGTIIDNKAKGGKLKDYLAGYVSDLYFDNFFYVYLDHFINGANYNVAINEQENLNDFLRLFAYKMNLSFNEASAFFNKIQTLQKLTDNELVILEKWLELS